MVEDYNKGVANVSEMEIAHWVGMFSPTEWDAMHPSVQLCLTELRDDILLDTSVSRDGPWQKVQRTIHSLGMPDHYRELLVLYQMCDKEIYNIIALLCRIFFYCQGRSSNVRLIGLYVILSSYRYSKRITWNIHGICYTIFAD